MGSNKMLHGQHVAESKACLNVSQMNLELNDCDFNGKNAVNWLS